MQRKRDRKKRNDKGKKNRRKKKRMIKEEEETTFSGEGKNHLRKNDYQGFSFILQTLLAVKREREIDRLIDG